MKFFKFLVIFFLALSLLGCAGSQNRKKYISLYYEAIYKNNYLSIVKKGDPKVIRQAVKRHLESAGYGKIIYNDAKYNFTVVGKQTTIYYASVAGNNYPCRIIYKLSQEAPYRARIDFARASDTPAINQQVDWDIQKIISQIERN